MSLLCSSALPAKEGNKRNVLHVFGWIPSCSLGDVCETTTILTPFENDSESKQQHIQLLTLFTLSTTCCRYAVHFFWGGGRGEGI